MWVKNHRFGQKLVDFRPNVGQKTIDLGKKCNRRELMLTPAEGQEVCCSTPFLSLSLCRLLRPPIPRLPSPPKKGVFPEIENIGLLCIKVPYFCLESSDVLPKELRCFCRSKRPFFLLFAPFGVRFPADMPAKCLNSCFQNQTI